MNEKRTFRVRAASLAALITTLLSLSLQTAPAITIPSAALYFSIQGAFPPQPFNPFPDLPLYDIGNGCFAYDDSNVDYSQLFPQTDVSLSPNGGEGQGEGAFLTQGEGAMMMDPSYSTTSGLKSLASRMIGRTLLFTAPRQT